MVSSATFMSLSFSSFLSSILFTSSVLIFNCSQFCFSSKSFFSFNISNVLSASWLNEVIKSWFIGKSKPPTRHNSSFTKCIVTIVSSFTDDETSFWCAVTSHDLVPERFTSANNFFGHNHPKLRQFFSSSGLSVDIRWHLVTTVTDQVQLIHEPDPSY